MIKNKTLHILEFDKILAAIAGFSYSEATIREIGALHPLSNKKEIELRFGQIEEIRRLAQMGIPLPIIPFRDITPFMEMVRPEGAVLDPHDLIIFLPILKTLAAISRQFAYRTDIPLLQELAGHFKGFPGIMEPLEASIDEEGNILDGASRILFDLRVRKRALNARIRKRLEEIVRERATAIFLQDDFITQRGGRWVIPVRMDSKGMVPGVVHDVSNSGETAFMEPIEIIGLANELENLAAEEKAEQIRILRQLCQWIREDITNIECEFRTLVQLDLRNSIARLADLLGAEVPEIGNMLSIRVAEGRHPILMLLQRERGGPDVVPLDLFLGEESRVMVITGPNAGGKTIAIKTTGLLLLMALSGIPTPAASTSVFPMVTSLLVDIGDEQSIEESLSTFSAHVSRIAVILAEADPCTLVLLDELGTGTEPIQGAAIACAVLNDLKEKGALVLATTHLTDIIGFVHRAEGMTNSAMEFDRTTLTPLYRFKCGEPGQSHALEIARRYGLPDRVIDFAKGMVGRMENEFHLLLAELKEKNRCAEVLLEDLEQRERLTYEKELRMEAAIAESRRKEREIIEKGWAEAKEIVQGARREINAILEQARREKTRAARTEIEAAGKRIDKRLSALNPEEQLSKERLAPGMMVFVSSIGYDAVITSLDHRHGRLRVRAGRIEMEVDISDAAPPKGKTTKPKALSRKFEEVEPPGLELKIIGLRVDEALPEMEKFLNRVSMEGGGTIRIIHGKGTGALMRAVREYLEGHPLVSEYRKGEYFEGGDGATVVTLH